MNSDTTFSADDIALSLDDVDSTTSPLIVNRYSQVYLKSEREQLLLVLPAEEEMVLNMPWSEIWQELKHHLQGREQSWQAGTVVSLLAKDQLLDVRQLQTIAETLSEVNLCLEKVCTSRRQTAVAAATAGYSVDQKVPDSTLSDRTEKNQSSSLADPLYLQNTVRSGVEVRHQGTVVVFGDLNPGGIIIAAGDIFLWGRLRGVAHAGAQGNRQARILALQMEPTQLRIADVVARAPKSPPKSFEPEIAYVASDGSIRLSQAIDFAKTHSFSEELGGWADSPPTNKK